MQIIYIYSWHDAFSLLLFALCWYVYALATGGQLTPRPSLNSLMNHERARWMHVRGHIALYRNDYQQAMT